MTENVIKKNPTITDQKYTVNFQRASHTVHARKTRTSLLFWETEVSLYNFLVSTFHYWLFSFQNRRFWGSIMIYMDFFHALFELAHFSKVYSSWREIRPEVSKYFWNLWKFICSASTRVRKITEIFGDKMCRDGFTALQWNKMDCSWQTWKMKVKFFKTWHPYLCCR